METFRQKHIVACLIQHATIVQPFSDVQNDDDVFVALFGGEDVVRKMNMFAPKGLQALNFDLGPMLEISAVATHYVVRILNRTHGHVVVDPTSHGGTVALVSLHSQMSTVVCVKV